MLHILEWNNHVMWLHHLKNLRKSQKIMPAQQKSGTLLLKRISIMLDELKETERDIQNQVVILSATKNNAIIQGLSKLPASMNEAFTPENIKLFFTIQVRLIQHMDIYHTSKQF